MQNVNDKTLFTFCLFQQQKMKKQNITVVKIHFKSLSVTVNHVTLMQPTLIPCSCYLSSLEDEKSFINILKPLDRSLNGFISYQCVDQLRPGIGPIRRHDCLQSYNNTASH